MPKLKIELEQHTSLIHFQAEQKGATLRATELKPKLDKYIYNNYQNKEELKNYTIRETNALNYKLKISDIDVTFEDIENSENNNSYYCFFGNLKSENDKDKPLKKFVHSNSLELEFFSYNENLIKIIAFMLPAFLRENNFGMRQSKGFGSFYINKEQKYCIDGVEEKYTNESIKFDKSWYRFEINTINEEIIFKNIELFYKTLRSGINLVRHKKTKLYFKSLIATYAYTNGIQWEKKTIKENFGDNSSIKENDKSECKEKRIVKDIMGLSVIENWNGKIISKKSKNIERFKSPIIFKPIKGEKSCIVYFKAFEYNKDILNHEFEINKIIQLKTIDKFDFNDFFEYALNINLYDYINTHSKGKFEEYMGNNIGKNTYEDIEKIYKSINKFKQEVK